MVDGTQAKTHPDHMTRPVPCRRTPCPCPFPGTPPCPTHLITHENANCRRSQGSPSTPFPQTGSQKSAASIGGSVNSRSQARSVCRSLAGGRWGGGGGLAAAQARGQKNKLALHVMAADGLIVSSLFPCTFFFDAKHVAC